MTPIAIPTIIGIIFVVFDGGSYLWESLDELFVDLLLSYLSRQFDNLTIDLKMIENPRFN